MTARRQLKFEDVVLSATGGKYKILQVLGQGKNASTYLVMATGGNAPHEGLLFALKMFDRKSSPISETRFKRETKFLGNCHHPAILQYYDSGYYQNRKDRPFVIVDYLPRTLHDAIRRGLPMVEKISFVLQLLSGLKHLASQIPPVVHCDLKPENIFLKGRSCVLGDFGLMRFCDESKATGEIVVPSRYPTPDLQDARDNGRPVTPKSDVYQLGLILLELFSATEIDYTSESAADQLKRAEIRGEHGSRIRKLIGLMLEPNPEARPSADDLIILWQEIFLEVATLSRRLEGTVF